ncbi:unnamed protein product [Anisakis simplex]|uniref:Translation initiation factor eIF2B subunit delta n=1 Tax=Anisakis simplex TaxID=6269 RepID=A0A0M3K1I1_ANISI|nr:unnamed protein product [Anisakis simplex]
MKGTRKKNPPNSDRRQSPNNDSKRKPQQSLQQTSANQEQNSVIDTPQASGQRSSETALLLMTTLTDLFNVTIDCLALHLILAMNKLNVSTDAKDLVKGVVDLKITNDINTQKARASQPIGSTPKSNPSKPTIITSDVEQLAKSKEEILAERKAKAAEAKAKKAAAAAAKKVTKGGEGATTPKATKSKDAKQKDSSASLNTSSTSNGHPTNGTEAIKSAFSSGISSSRPSQPFRRVHFDMTPSEGASAVGRRRQPSFTDVSPVNVHPAFLNFAARCEAKEVTGIDAICVEFICAFKQFLNEYNMSENRKMSHDLDQAIRPHFSYMTQNGTQPFPFALGNLIRQLKKEINQLPDGISELDGKNRLLEWLDDFCSQNFDLALRAISSFCLSKMQSTHYILTYSWCPIVERVLLDAYDQNMNLHVCILDSPVEPKGRRLTKTLSSRNIECTYGMLSAIGYVMKQCHMVLLGCSAILSNGYVVAERGAAQVALVAAAANVPVLVVAQTLKFVDRVQTFDRSNREVSALVGERQESIPSDLITAIVTELRIVPPSSAPAVLKAKQLAVG